MGGGGVKMSGPSTSSCHNLFLAIIKRALFGLACVACLTVQGEHAKGRGGLLFKKKKMASATQSMIGYGEGTYSLEFMRVSKQRNEPAGDGPGAGVRSCYTGSSIMSSKMYKRRHLLQRNF